MRRVPAAPATRMPLPFSSELLIGLTSAAPRLFMRHTYLCLGTALALLAASPSVSLGQPARPLTVVSAGPTGEIASLAEANEIRIVFSEPMVTLGRIPAEVHAPFVTIR